MTRHGYAQAYSEGFERTVRFLISRGAQAESAQEAAQAGWARGWERLHQLRDDNMVITWVNTIALNVHRRSLRRQALVQPLPELQSTVSVNFAAIDVSRVLRVCRPADRHLLEQQMQGASAREIAEDQGVTETAVRIRLLRARRSARTRLSRMSSRSSFVKAACGEHEAA